MSSYNRFTRMVHQGILILAILFSSFAPNFETGARNLRAEDNSILDHEFETGLTIGENKTLVTKGVPILSEEIAKQAQGQSDDALRIKLSAEPAIYIQEKPVVVSWKLIGGGTNKTSGLQIVIRPSTGVIPVNARTVIEADGSVIISPAVDTGSIAWKVLDTAEFPLSFSIDLVAGDKVLSTNSVLVDQPMMVTSVSKTSRGQSENRQDSKNKVEVTIPSNAARAPMLMGIRYPSPNALGGSSLSWNPVEVIAVDENTAKNVTKFKNPITIQITYDEKEIFDWAEKDLSVYYYDPDLLDWFPMATEVDTANNTLTVQSDHLTVFDYKANTWQAYMAPTVEGFKTSDFTGAGTYQINLWTPPGPGGLQPSIALSYNSQVVDESSAFTQASWVGMGWDLDTGMVTRNMHDTNDDWSDDTFYISAGGISGQLLPISSSGGITQYNTVDQSFMKVEGNDNTYSFTAWAKDGTKYVFGDTTDNNYNNGCATSNNHTWRWGLSSITDIHGNTINYTYQAEKKGSCANEIAVYPSTISYVNGKYSVEFVREGRTDYQTSWTSTTARVLYGTQRLKEVQIKHNGSIIKKYVMSYAPNNSSNIYPNFNFSAGGKMLTLLGVQEFGSDGSALPAVTLAYSDYMHLTTVNNGQGGSVTMAYTDWQYFDDVNTDIRTVGTIFQTQDCVNGAGASPTWTQVSGKVRCDGSKLLQVGNNPAQASVGERVIPQGMIKPSAKYKFKINVRAIYSTTSLSWGIVNGTNTTMLSASGVTTTGGEQTSQLLTMPVTYNPNSVKLRFSCSQCFFRSFSFTQYVVLYRVISRTVTVQPTGVVSTYTYQYDNASPATVDNSAAAAAGGTLYAKKLREFRGHAMSQVTNPEGLTTVNWFWQADGLKGRGYDSLVLQRDAFDALESVGAGWTASGTTTAVAEAQKDFDNSIKTVGGTLTRTNSLAVGKVAVAHVRLVSGTGTVKVGNTIVTLNSAGTATVNGASLLGGTNFKVNEWYAVMFFTDAANNRVRIWQLDDPNNSGEAVLTTGGGGAFSSGVSSGGTIYTDSYFEGTPYSETITRFGSTVQYDNTTGGTIPDIASTTLMTFKDLFVTWTYPVSVENRNYNGDAVFVGTKQTFTYATAANFGNLTQTVEAGNNGSGWADYRKTIYEYYPIVSPVVSPTRYLTSFPARQTVTDAGNNLQAETLYFYDNQAAYTSPPVKGDLTTQRVWAGNNHYAQTSMTYDSYGNVLTQSAYTEYGTATSNPPDSSRQTTTTTYDVAGYNTYPQTVTNQLGQTVSTAYNYAFGLPNSVTDANGVTTSATYDGFGRMKTITAPGDTSPTLTVNYFDASIPFKVDLIQTVSASSAIRLSRFYDGAGRQIQTQTANAMVNGTPQNIVVDYQYNAAGRMVKQTVPYAISDSATPSFNSQSFAQSYTSTVYDVIGRATTTTAPNGAVVSNTYTDLTTTVTDPKLNSTTTTVDVWGRTKLVDVPAGPDVSYEYDVLNRLTDASRGGATTHIEYDILGRKTSMDDPDMGSWSYTYDALGNLKSQTDAKGQLTCLYYDALNRLDGKVYSTGGCGAPVNFDVNYAYDAGTNGIGRRTSMTDTSGTTVWTYDPRGRLSTETKTISGAASPFITSWIYNTGDLPVVMTYPDGETLTYGYNSDGTLKSVASNTILDPSTSLGQVYLNDMQYDEAGRLKLMQYGSNIITKTFNYFSWTTADMGGLLASVSASAGATPLQNLAYTYDRNGNALTIVDALAAGGPQTQAFTYDALNRITSATATGGTNGLYTETYDYDADSGNLSLKNNLTYTYGDTAHIHAATALSNGNSYGYDANGNMTARTVDGQVFDLAYDAENRLTSVDAPGVQILPSPTPTLPATETPSATSTSTITQTATETSTPTETSIPTDTLTPTETVTPQDTATPTDTAIPTDTLMPTETATATEVTTPTETHTPDPLASPTETSTAAETPTETALPTETFTPADTVTPSATETITETPTQTPTATVTLLPTETMTSTFTPTATLPPVTVFANAAFTYDGDSRRVKSVMLTNIAETTTYFVGNYYELTDGVAIKYYYAGGQRIAMRKNGTLNYVIGDHLGSTSIVTDAAGVIVSQQEYKAWGETRSASGSEATKYQYTGQYSYASDFGLMFYNARWYDPSLGRFAQADTIVPAGVQGYDRYAYTNNNPLKYTDPSGHKIVCAGPSDSYCYDDSIPAPVTPTPTPTPAPASSAMVFCGSQGGGNMSAAGPECTGPVLDAWNPQYYGFPAYAWWNNLVQYPENKGNGKYMQFMNAKSHNLNLGNAPILFGYSAGSEAALMYALDRIEQGLAVKSIVLLDPTFTGINDGYGHQTTFDDWKVYMDKILNSGTSILVIDDNGSNPKVIDININARDYSKPEGAKGHYLYQYMPYSHYADPGAADPTTTTNLSAGLAAAAYSWAQNPQGQ